MTTTHSKLDDKCDEDSVTLAVEKSYMDTLQVIFFKALAALIGSKEINITHEALAYITMLAELHLDQLIKRMHKLCNIQRRQEPSLSDIRLTMDSVGLKIHELEEQRGLHSKYIDALNHLQLDFKSEPLGRDEEAFFNTSNEHVKKLVPSRKQPGEHVPNWMPAYPPDHTFMATPVYSERVTDPRALREKLVEEGRLAEDALRRITGKIKLKDDLAEDEDEEEEEKDDKEQELVEVELESNEQMSELVGDEKSEVEEDAADIEGAADGEQEEEEEEDGDNNEDDNDKSEITLEKRGEESHEKDEQKIFESKSDETVVLNKETDTILLKSDEIQQEDQNDAWEEATNEMAENRNIDEVSVDSDGDVSLADANVSTIPDASAAIPSETETKHDEKNNDNSINEDTNSNENKNENNIDSINNLKEESSESHPIRSTEAPPPQNASVEVKNLEQKKPISLKISFGKSLSTNSSISSKPEEAPFSLASTTTDPNIKNKDNETTLSHPTDIKTTKTMTAAEISKFDPFGLKTTSRKFDILGYVARRKKILENRKNTKRSKDTVETESNKVFNTATKQMKAFDDQTHNNEDGLNQDSRQNDSYSESSWLRTVQHEYEVAFASILRTQTTDTKPVLESELVNCDSDKYAR